jgi:iron(III) transport system ATP-binding protein
MRIDTLPPEKRGFGMVFQNYALFPHMTVSKNIDFGLRMRGVAASEIAPRLAHALKLVQLTGQEHKLPGQLSGGQQQRVAIARAIVIEPPLILMDEPLSNLDAKLREEARAWLRELIVRLHISALVVTHDQTEAMAMSDRILLLNFGVIEQQGTPEEMYNRPQTQFTAEFMGSNNHLPGKVAEVADGRALLEGEGWRLWGVPRGELKPGDTATGIIRLERTQIADGAADNRVRTEVITGMFLGDRREILFKLGELRLRCYGNAPAGGECWLEFPRESLWVFPAAASV